MDISVIREAMTTKPFRSFVMRMNDGTEFEIGHPDRVFLHSNHVTIVDERNGKLVYLEPLLIASLTVDDPTTMVADGSWEKSPGSQDS